MARSFRSGSRRLPTGALIGLVVGSWVGGCAVYRPAFKDRRTLTEEGFAVIDGARAGQTPAGGPAEIGERLAGSAEAARELLEAVPAAARPGVRHNPRLDRVAYLYAAAMGELGRSPTRGLGSWMLWTTGISSVFDQSAGYWATGYRALGQLRSQVAEFAAGRKWDRGPYEFGVARFEVGSRLAGAVIVARRYVDLEELPSRVEPGQTLQLKGRLLRPAARLAVFLGSSEPVVWREELTPQADGAFEVTLKMPGTPGRAFLQIEKLSPVESDPSGEHGLQETLALVPIAVGTPAPARPDAFLVDATPELPDARARALVILGIYNAARAAAKLPPLSLDDRASALALTELEAPAGGAEPDKQEILRALAQRGVPVRSGRWLHSSREQSSAEYAQTSLLVPAHREAVLDRRNTRLGLATGLPKGPDDELTVVEYLFEPLPPFVREERVPAFFEAINRLRAARGKPPFVRHEPLEPTLQRFAQQVCAGGEPRPKLELVWAEIERDHGSVQGYAHEFSGRYLDPGDLKKRLEPVLQADQPLISLALCRGDDPAAGPHEYALVLLSTPRPVKR